MPAKSDKQYKLFAQRQGSRTNPQAAYTRYTPATGNIDYTWQTLQPYNIYEPVLADIGVTLPSGTMEFIGSVIRFTNLSPTQNVGLTASAGTGSYPDLFNFNSGSTTYQLSGSAVGSVVVLMLDKTDDPTLSASFSWVRV